MNELTIFRGEQRLNFKWDELPALADALIKYTDVPYELLDVNEARAILWHMRILPPALMRDIKVVLMSHGGKMTAKANKKRKEEK